MSIPEPTPSGNCLRLPLIIAGVLIVASVGPMPTAAAAETDEAGMLWRVPGKTNNVYLLGSVHMLRESDFPLPGDIETAYADAEALVMELDMDDLDPLAIQGLFFARGTLPDDKTLADVLGATKWQQASADARKLGIDLSMLSRVKPWWAAITIVQLQLVKTGFDPDLGLEGYFTRRASADKKPIEGLETAAFQVELFDAMDEARQVEMLTKSLADAATLDVEMGKLLSAWRRGEAEVLAELLAESFEGFPALYASVIRKRNEAWIQELANLLDDERDYLVVVGAFHLVGEDGVPAGLARLGYEVIRE